MSANVFVARQPIFNRSREVFGYELLYRSHAQQAAYAHANPDQASACVINNTLNVMGLDELSNGKHIFVNITRDLLLSDDYSILPPQRSVIELLETVEPTTEVVDACVRLKEAGYVLALDDFVFSPAYQPLLAIADILKIDFMATDADRRAKLINDYGGKNLLFLAEKVENQAELNQAMELGYTYFQGYFFCKPEVVPGSEPAGFKRNYLRFLQSINQNEINYGDLEQVIKQEVSLSTKLLRYLNSPAFGMRSKVGSIRQALALLGDRPLRKWASLVALASMGQDKPPELAITCMIRARFCESLAGDLHMPERELDLFLLGLLSGLDALMDQTLSELLTSMPVAHDVSAALLGANSTLGKLYGLVLAIERGMWKRVTTLNKQLGLTDEQVSQAYRQAVTWSDQIFKI